MIRPQLILDINQELFVDNFAGGGGASTGIELALGRHVDHAINHDRYALGMHRINHAQTVHHCEDVFDIDPLRVTEGRRIGAGWFSPDCRHFSKAKGGKPLSKKIRGLAFVMFRWAAIRTRVMFMENVEEIQDWGPLFTDHSHGCRGKGGSDTCTSKLCHYGRPIPEHKGRTWRAFLSVLGSGIHPEHPDIPEMLEVLNSNSDSPVRVGRPAPVTKEQLVGGFGYQYDFRELRACDYGAPTIRKRLFAIFRCDGKPIVWPEPTHYNPKKGGPERKGMKPWNIIADCIDWSLPCPSIFLTPEQARKHNCRRPLADSTLRRVATGVDRYVLKAKQPFTVCLTHQGGDRVESVTEPGSTITAAHRGEKAVVSPTFVGVGGRAGQSRPRPGNEPAGTGTSKADVSIVQTELVPFIGDANRPFKAQANASNTPLNTACAGIKGGHFQLVTGTIVGAGGPARNGEPRPVDRVMHGLTADNNSYLAAVNMVQRGHKSTNSEMVKGADEPMRCQTSAQEHAVIAANLIEFHSPKRPGDERVRPVTEALPVQTTEPRFALSAANMVKLRGDPGTHPSAPADEPGHTISAAGQHHAVSSCYLAQHNGGNVGHQSYGHDARTPASTISAKGSQQQVVEASCINAYYGSEKAGQPIDSPLRTATTEERFNIAKATAVCPGLTEAQVEGARRVAKFLRDHGVKFEGEFATITLQGTVWVIVDIGMRMLSARELFRAQGFPESYCIDRAWLVDPKTGALEEVTLTKEQQIRMCGNSVCPPIAKALVAANVPELGVWFKGERKRPTVRKQTSLAVAA